MGKKIGDDGVLCTESVKYTIYTVVFRSPVDKTRIITF